MRTVSLTAMQALLAQATPVAFLDLIVVEHDDLEEPMRFVANTVAITHQGEEFSPAPIKLELPSEPEDEVPTAKLIVSNVDRALIATVRTLTTAPTITAMIVTDVTPDVVEYGPITMKVITVQYDRNALVFELGFDQLTAEPFPFLELSPSKFPGMFKG